MTAKGSHRSWQKYWKIYAWFNCIMLLVSFVGSLVNSNFSIQREVIEDVIAILVVIAIFAYAYQKTIMKAYVWKIFLIILLADDIYGTIDTINNKPHMISFWLAMAITSVLFIINIIAVYLYAFRFFRETEAHNKIHKAR
jgi:hypothetical protein